MKKSELVFVPSPGVGHLVPAVEIAKLMVKRDDRLSITVLLVDLPNDEQTSSGITFLGSFIESQKPHVKNAVLKLQSESSSESTQLAGFVVGMFCTTMIDVANEFGVPSYVFFASSAAALSLMLYMQALNDEKNVDTTEFKDSDAEFMLPGIINPVPAKVLPSVVFNKDWHPLYFGNARRFKEAEGIMVNTYVELESQVINAFSNGKTPPLYPIGPILNLKGDGHDVGSAETNKNKDIMEWLDDQPPSSVVFLCFGSMGSFGEEQLKEIARALEQSEYRKDFRAENDVIVSADIIEKGIRSVMEQDSEVRKKVKAMSEMSKKALLDGGSSHSFMGRLIEDMMNNME
ncbi:hypothetical protein OIU76_021592 [Salix suchowensis]|nr:hypothetical protein OIU76_021592 [Salix suchowensis]